MADVWNFGANPFRIRTYRNASRTIHDFSEPLEKIPSVQRGWTDIDGIGPDLAEKIETLFIGQAAECLELQAQVPASVLALLRIPGLHPRGGRAASKELGIQSLDHLKATAGGSRRAALKGLGEKTEATILAGLEIRLPRRR